MIPFHKVYDCAASHDYVAEAMKSGELSGDGMFTAKCEKLLEELTNAPRVLLTASCSIALDMCAMLIDAGAEDEIIVPSFTFVTSAGAFYNRGAKPMFVDCDPVSFNLDLDDVERKITPRTKAIVVVHYNGIACDMNRLMQIADKHGLIVIEDAAQAVDSYKEGKHLGTFGHLATFSFHESKNIVCGEGGALIINDKKFIERAEIIREKGTNRKQFFKGQVDKYTWRDIGSSYVMSDMLAAYLLGQLEARAEIKTRRKAHFEMYLELLADVDIQLPHIGAQDEPSYHLFPLLLPHAEERERVMSSMKEQGVQTTFHYVPLHLSPVGLSLGNKEGSLPVTEDISARLIRLPLYPDLTPEEVEQVAAALKETLSVSHNQEATG